MTTPKREYIIGLLNYDDLDNFYNDMESAGVGMYGCFPDREIECANRRNISRNTHYWLTDEEADQIRKDPRVIVVSLTPEELGIKIHPLYEETSSNWNRSFTVGINSHRNWGKLRSTINEKIPNWGGLNDYENISTVYSQEPNQTATINIPSSGKHVDVVIVDGHIDPIDHPEFAVNPDGTGGSRVKQLNWFGLGVGVSGTYTYTRNIYGQDHGTHVAGTVAGNSQGWARDANIYNLYPYGSISTSILFDYIRAFHKQKAINPVTGRKNPTIVNNSWGASEEIPVTAISEINYRNTKNTWNILSKQYPLAADLSRTGITRNSQSTYTTIVNPSVSGHTSSILDIEDAISEGIILLAAAGNDGRKLSQYGDEDYDNNLIRLGIYTHFFNRGGYPSVAPGMICVGALGSMAEDYKSPFSACGPRVDVYAPGVNIISSVSYSNGYSGDYDFRNDRYFISKKSGTSMASPQVTGVLACVLELYPNMTQYDALLYIKKYGLTNQMTYSGNSDDTMGPYDCHDLAGSSNRILKYNKERNSTGAVYPKLNVSFRQQTGLIPYTYENGWREEFKRTPSQLDLAIWIGTKLYESNDQFTTTSGIRYGLYKQPDAAALDYWVQDSISRFGDLLYFDFNSRNTLINNFFIAVAATAEASRATTSNKTFLYGPAQTRGTIFSDRPDKKAGQVYPRPRIYTFGVQKSN